MHLCTKPSGDGIAEVAGVSAEWPGDDYQSRKPLGSGAGSDSRTHWQGDLASPLPSPSAHTLICMKVEVGLCVHLSASDCG